MVAQVVQLKMLIIDDSLPYVEALYRTVQRFNIQLRHAGSLEEGREIFEGYEGSTIVGVILDVKCMKTRRQEVPDNSFITAAIKYFSDKASHLPLVVLTGETEQFNNLKELYEGTLRVFSKGRDEIEMVAYLLAEAKKLDWVKIRQSYQDVFAVIDRFLDKEAEQELIGCLKEIDNTDFTVIKNSLSCLRRLQEKIYLAINRADVELLPQRFVGSELNIVGAYKHLSETGQVERYKIIDRFSELIYKITSDNGAHTPHANPKYPPTRYSVHAVTFAMLDLLLWFGALMERNQVRQSEAITTAE
jgi:ActR/RegA family two-component response regulator